jgi:phage replication O-like protein O
MASPQCENGYTKIANELFEAILRTEFAGREFRVMLSVIRLTYGFGKKKDAISYGQISKITGISRRNVIHIINRLVSRATLGSVKGDTRKPSTIWINKDYCQWKAPSVKDDTIKPSVEDDTRNSVKGDTTPSVKDDTLQRNKRKKERKPTVFPDWLDKELWTDFKEHRRKLRKPMTNKAEQLLINKLGWLKDQGHNPRHLLITSIERGWLTVFEPDKKGN